MCNCKEYEQAKKYRIARGNLEESIENFNNAIKELEIELLRYQLEYPSSEDYDAFQLKDYIHKMYMELTEKDTIILCCKKNFYGNDNELREFNISKERKVTDAIKFYDEYLRLKDYIQPKTILFGTNSYIYKQIEKVFKDLKEAFLAFADI